MVTVVTQEPDNLMNHSNDILTAIVQGMHKDETDFHVKRAATNAMLNTLEFTKDNFDLEVENLHSPQSCPFVISVRKPAKHE